MGQGTSSSRTRYGLKGPGSRAEGPSCIPHGVPGLLGPTPGCAVEGLGSTEPRLLPSQSGGGGGHSTQPQESPDRLSQRLPGTQRPGLEKRQRDLRTVSSSWPSRGQRAL